MGSVRHIHRAGITAAAGIRPLVKSVIYSCTRRNTDSNFLGAGRRIASRSGGNLQSFLRQINLYIIQCDDQIRAEQRIISPRELADYMEHFTLIGQSATDFRPVFARVNELQKAGAFHRLRGILYFTDGLGIYPSKRPPYDAAFVMLAGQGYPERVPPWGIRVVLDPDTLETGGNQ